jgi:NodT family efflux transporter outer membrane factor (OMF) lipoprotein
MISRWFLLQVFLVATFLGLQIVVLGGCAVHSPEGITLLAPLPESFTEKPLDSGPMPAPDRWWEAFKDERLNRLMELAFAGNLDLDQAYARLRQFEAVARKSGAARLPFVNLEGNASRSRRLGAMDAETGGSYELSVAAGFEVDLWNKLKSRTRARELETEASLEDIRTLYLTISAQVADLYYLMVEQRSQLDLTDQTVEAREATVELVERRYLEGIVLALDVYQARQTLAAARARRPEFEATLGTAAHALSVLIGNYPDQTVGGDLAVIPEVPAAFPVGLPSELLSRRPDIRAELFRLKASDQEIGVAVANRFPSINLLADYGRAGSDFGISLSETVWSLIGNMTLPLLDWGSRKVEVDRTRAVFDEQLSRYRQAVLVAFQEVEDALVNNRTTEEAIRRLEEEEAAARSALRLATDRYIDGLSDYLPVLTAQALHFDARRRLLSARRKLISDRISLARALGGSWIDQETEKRLSKRMTGP